MTELQELRRRLEATERRLRWTLASVTVLGAAVLIGAVLVRPAAGGTADTGQEVLRAGGLVITDEMGRDRIVLGAPMGNASSDPTLAAATGLAVLDSLGRLQVAVGRDNPLVMAGGETGERIASSSGLTIYDPRDGRERGGIGAFADGRANVCLDYGTGAKEAACMAVAPGDQYAAVILNGTPTEEVYDRVVMYVGADGTGSIKAFGGGANQGGVMIRAGRGLPSVTVYDSTGAAVEDLVGDPGGGS